MMRRARVISALEIAEERLRQVFVCVLIDTANIDLIMVAELKVRVDE